MSAMSWPTHWWWPDLLTDDVCVTKIWSERSALWRDELHICLACQRYSRNPQDTVFLEIKTQPRWTVEMCVHWNCSCTIVQAKAAITHVRLRTALTVICWSMHSPTHLPVKFAAKLSSVRRTLVSALYLSNGYLNIYCVDIVFAVD